MSDPEPAIVVRPANRASWSDLQLIFGSRGPAARCWCQRFKLAPKESFGSVPAEARSHRLREQTDCDHPESTRTSGLVAYADDEPVGWCAVEPRPHYAGLVRVFRVPWDGRTEDRTDPGVWAVTCLLTRAGHRGNGVSRALARAAVDFARSQGAAALEAYPIITPQAMVEELHVGTVATFAAAGLREVGHPTPRRLVMRVDFR
jgi:GNAT superfamily N-acetyltransferase